jgi:hypothetical protein
MPRTSQRASIAPKAPRESRSATMRPASEGPMPGSASISAADARSRSMGVAGKRAGSAGSALDVTVRVCRVVRTESTRRICRSSAADSVVVTCGTLARQSLTPPPDSATRARNQSALRSLAVGTTYNCVVGSRTLTPFERANNDLRAGCLSPYLAISAGHLMSRVSATSPTICKLFALILSIVSCMV